MKEYIHMLSNTSIFEGLCETELETMINCLSAVKKSYKKNSYIFSAGDNISSMGLMISGSALLIQEDFWGRRNIITQVATGEVFAEIFAASSNVPINLSVITAEDCEVLMLDMNKVMTVCPSACECHNKVIRNLITILSKKALLLNDKITHMSKHSTKEKLLSYLSSQSLRNGSLVFDIPYDRQQLADYLCVERAAMSAELSKLQKEGMIEYKRNHFKLLKQ